MATKKDLVNDILDIDPKADVSEDMKHEQLATILSDLKADEEAGDPPSDELEEELQEEVEKASKKSGKGEQYKAQVFQMACFIASNPNYDTRTGVNMPKLIAEEAIKVTDAIIEKLN